MRSLCHPPFHCCTGWIKRCAISIVELDENNLALALVHIEILVSFAHGIPSRLMLAATLPSRLLGGVMIPPIPSASSTSPSRFGTRLTLPPRFSVLSTRPSREKSGAPPSTRTLLTA